ncbi:CheR family methyltransferase [Thermospira aquatica]|uniref:Protein-glutamate O-methyltransferase CheR n=1 Tax=Thermospira aquatica TaxID=2828656 RepID=A0AAX3BDF3_9SPIR|nr:protein-glutamate O-methyltransferase CheR [Thermospira aquatica]URA10150.1 protein-glutamate O-methyltransferase CheR [Thermospira aquatica]
MERYLKEAKKILKEVTGISLTEEKDSFLLSIINTILQRENFSPDAYLALLQSDFRRVIELATYFTVQETSFYRNRDHFRTLKEIILPELITLKKDKKLSILSAGCATGEEPYTIAMILDDSFQDALKDWEVTLCAVDISQEAIKEAQKGIYSEYKMKNIDNYYIEKYFEKEVRNLRTLYHLKSHIKSKVLFFHQNLLAPGGILDSMKFDIIFCENVIIYFDNLSIEKLIQKFYNSLNTHGYLFLGYSETLNMVHHRFALCWHDHTYYYKKEEQKKEEQKLEVEIKKTENKKLSVCENHVLSTSEEGVKKELFESYDEFLYHIMKNYLTNRDAKMMELYSCFFQMYSRDPSFIQDEKAFLLFGEFFIDKNNLAEAQKMGEMAVEKRANSLDAHNLNACIFLLSDRPTEALLSVSIAYRLNQNNKITLYLMYKVYTMLNNKTKAREIFAILKEVGDDGSGSFFPYNPNRRVQFYTAINKIISEEV